jgi:hypothetical protein
MREMGDPIPLAVGGELQDRRQHQGLHRQRCPILYWAATDAGVGMNNPNQQRGEVTGPGHERYGAGIGPVRRQSQGRSRARVVGARLERPEAL